MKKYFFHTSVLAFFLILGACASHTTHQLASAVQSPALGSVIKTQGVLWFQNNEEVGIPAWQNINVTAKAMPFNKERYGHYSKMVKRSNLANTIPFNDSLHFKPKYVRLQLLDKIALTEQLNQDANRTVRQYLEHDADFKLVTSLDVALTEADIALLTQAETLQLNHNEEGALILQVVSGQDNRYFTFSDLPVFDLGYSSFCWGEDRYHNLRIQNVTSLGEKCPRGTHVKSNKVAKKRDYLKL